MLKLTAVILLLFTPILLGMVAGPGPSFLSKTKRNVLFSGWQYHPPPSSGAFFPRTDNYYYRIKPESVVEIVVDPLEVEDIPLGHAVVEHSSITTSVQSHGEYKSSCVKEPGCRWECEPRQDELPPDCDCVCFYTDSKWDSMP